MAELDLEAIIAEVARKQKILLSEDDPVLTVALLGEAGLKAVIKDLADSTKEAMATATDNWARSLVGATAALTRLEKQSDNAVAALTGRFQLSLQEVAKDVRRLLEEEMQAAAARSRTELQAAAKEIRAAAEVAVKAKRWSVAAAVFTGCASFAMMLLILAPVFLHKF